MHSLPTSETKDYSLPCASLSREDRLMLLALQHLQGFTAAAHRQLLISVDKPSQCLDLELSSQQLGSLSPAARKAFLNFRRAPKATRAWQAACRNADWLEAHGATILPYTSAEFPSRVRELSDCPPFLFALGDLNMLYKAELISIVGTRKPTVQGSRFAYKLASDLANQGHPVVSGMAEGIDSAVHQGALAGLASTVAVWAAGLDKVYPATAKPLANEIAKRGLILTEMPPGTPTLRGLFVRRNRIVAALSEVTVVVEAEQKSGSLITAEFALDLNREIAAVPGAINTRKSAGCHHLIKQGAALVENSQDVLDLLSGVRTLDITANAESDSRAQLSVDQRKVLNALEIEPLPAEVLLVRTELEFAELSQVLIDLELQGLLLSVGGIYQLSVR